MSKPIGIPSGWEEISAWVMGNYTTNTRKERRQRMIMDINDAYQIGLGRNHDWRCEAAGTK